MSVRNAFKGYFVYAKELVIKLDIREKTIGDKYEGERLICNLIMMQKIKVCSTKSIFCLKLQPWIVF